MVRVVMFVMNDVRRDARVRREASTLAAAGYEVTIIGRPTDPDTATAEREQWQGVDILRIPVPGRFRGQMLGAGGGRTAPPARPAVGPSTTKTSISSARLLVLLARAATRLPILGGLFRGVDLLMRWRLGTVAWGRAAAAASPPAAVWHAHDLTGIPAALDARRRHGGRLIYDSHELFTEAGDTATRPAWARMLLRRYEARAIRAADAVITVNDGLASELRRIAAPRRMVVVRNTPPAPPDDSRDPIGSPGAPPDRLRAALSLAPGTPVVLSHGSLALHRGLPELIEAMRGRGLEQAHLVLMGDGALAGDLARLAGAPDLGGRVHVLPSVPPDQLPAWVSSASVEALPIQPSTLNHRLSTPNKLFEAIGVGVPVVTSDFPAMRAIVLGDPDGTLGEVCDPTDPASIAAALSSILDLDPAAAAALRNRCLGAARRRWNWESQSAGLLALYADLAPIAAVPGATTRSGSGAPPMPQRVTFVLPSSGAFDARTRRMSTSLAARGHEVLVIARSEPGLAVREEIAPGAAFRRVDAGGPPPRRGGGGVRGPARLISDLVRMARIAGRVRAQTHAARLVDRSASIYHGMGFLALPIAVDLAQRAGAPFVYDARDLYAEGNNIARLPGLLRSVFARRERSWARRAAAVLTVNESLADELERRLGVERPAVVINAQAAWSPPDPRPDHLRAALTLPAGTPLVLYHGGYMRDRGLPEAIAAMRTPGLETAHLVLMGSGELEAALTELAAAPESEGRVHLLPPVPPAELLDWVASADVGVMTNQPRTINERLSTPNKLFECLAAGTPVVSSDFPERRRIIAEDPDGPLGALCDPTDPASIGAAIRSIIGLDAAAAADLRARCLQATAARYDWERQFQTLLQTYERVTGNRW